ncbi:T9SS type A sorting domain-containing protein [Rurimicrobium arvi]|uniref:Secretion system C-terminal sorting domain-containing protein n=1 Tax=Rurimicrobium arvi TaxID=2049916 RepID=A0ABP8N0W9_9BACT
MKPLFTLMICMCLAMYSIAQYADPNFPKPASGYGSDGPHPVAVARFANPAFSTKDIEIYYPSDATTPVPCIFYSHAFGGNISGNIIGMLDFVAMKGYAIVFVPYQTTGVSVADRYDNLLNGFRLAARTYPSVIDTTRVGFMGHSFGGGASFALAYQCFTENNWGSKGRFVYALAQWYSYNISETQLKSFPADTKLLAEVFDDDVTNDHRMAQDIFRTINIADSEKDYLLLKSDTIAGYVYEADHSVPNTASAFDALDYYAYYRFIDALCDYTFNGSAAGKNVALGNGSAAQVTMPGTMKPLSQTDRPVALYPQSKYEYPCADTQNPRSAYCSDGTSIAEQQINHNVSVYPNPATGSIQIESDEPLAHLSVYDFCGRAVLEANASHTHEQISISPLKSGLYLLECNTVSGTVTRKLFVKQ